MHVLAHGRAAEDQRLDGEKAGVAGEIDLGAAIEAGGVEQDGRLRQPGKAGARFQIDADADGAFPVACPVDLLGRRRGDRQRGASASVTSMSSCRRRSARRRC